MGFGDALSKMANEQIEKNVRILKEKLRGASDDVVRKKWEQVNEEGYDSRFVDAVEDEMRRRGLLY